MSDGKEGLLGQRVRRDEGNAARVRQRARDVVRAAGITVRAGGFLGAAPADEARARYERRRLETLAAIAEHPFQAMVEVEGVYPGEGGREEVRALLWYINADAPMAERVKLREDGNADARGEGEEVPADGEAYIDIVPWTHPGAQLALAAEIGARQEIHHGELRIQGVRPLARARFHALAPELSGVYEPGGPVGQMAKPAPATGLKAVKLDMTRPQVEAFIARTSGLMVISGAPGSGKTTVALQRMRFLFDQQASVRDAAPPTRYTPDLTRVFLANANLAEQTSRLLKEELDVSESIVLAVDKFVARYIHDAWPYRHDARLREHALTRKEAAARSALVGLMDHRDLEGLWQTYERQIVDRLAAAVRAPWLKALPTGHARMLLLAEEFHNAGRAARRAENPRDTRLGMGHIFRQVSHAYNGVREAMPAGQRTAFETAVQRWLFWVYDPLDAVSGYVSRRPQEAIARIRQGTGGKIPPGPFMFEVHGEWKARRFALQDRPLFAWLLRFALPEDAQPHARFRNIPSALGPATTNGERWSHIVFDEAQDLCVAEASLLASLVHPDGAVTVSADFRQVVSPTWGMTGVQALEIGRSLRAHSEDQYFPFARNMRQTMQIGRFLQGFYEAAFGEGAPFDVNTSWQDVKPWLAEAPLAEHAHRIREVLGGVRRADAQASVAVLQINEDEKQLRRLREDLEALGVELAPMWSATGPGLYTTSVERIKGLEFDACIVLGMEGVETNTLNFTLNRAYVALSRPTRWLVLLCREFPSILRRVDGELFEV